MSSLRFQISVSLDGYVAGPEAGPEHPLGIGGERLHEWIYPLEAWRKSHGLEGGIENESTPMVEFMSANVGATVMGRNMFGGGPGPWEAGGEWGDEPWTGWWGEDPPFRHPVFVLTHYPREPLEMPNGTTFTFVTEGIEAALRLAREAADGANVLLGGGASVARQYVAAGLIDRMILHVVPVLLGGGVRLFDGISPEAAAGLDLQIERVIDAPGVTHLEYRPSAG